MNFNPTRKVDNGRREVREKKCEMGRKQTQVNNKIAERECALMKCNSFVRDALHQVPFLSTNLQPRISNVSSFAFACLLVCVFAASPAGAQQPSGKASQFELAGSYAYTRGSIGDSDGSFNLSGGSASFSYNFRDRLAFVGDFGAYHFSGLGPGLTSTMYTYLFGPRLAIRHTREDNRVMPFAQVLLGGGRLNAGANGISAGDNSFAMAVGGGLDLSSGHHFSIRLFEGEYLLTRFANPDGSSDTQSNLRLSAGLIFRFGSR
jgi:hypothetical protein